jgi:hypothetical protein
VAISFECLLSLLAFSLTTLIFLLVVRASWSEREKEKKDVMLDHASMSTSPVWEMRQQTLEQTGSSIFIYLLYQD